jgi:hypothetical protein
MSENSSRAAISTRSSARSRSGASTVSRDLREAQDHVERCAQLVRSDTNSDLNVLAVFSSVTS